jgi:hypothetical protein
VYYTPKVRREAGLDAQEWTFTIIEEQVVLQTYRVLTRETKRHKERGRQYYNRLNERNSTMKQAEVPLPDDVAAEALAQVLARFRVVRAYG